MDEKEAEARPVMGTIFLVVILQWMLYNAVNFISPPHLHS